MRWHGLLFGAWPVFQSQCAQHLASRIGGNSAAAGASVARGLREVALQGESRQVERHEYVVECRWSSRRGGYSSAFWATHLLYNWELGSDSFELLLRSIAADVECLPEGGASYRPFNIENYVRQIEMIRHILLSYIISFVTLGADGVAGGVSR